MKKTLAFRQSLYKFFQQLRSDDGSFLMHKEGELDIRGVYCAVAVAKLTNLYTSELFKNTEKWISDCQTWEGGFGGCPDMEAHGGYTYCGLASLVLLDKSNMCHLPSLLVIFVHSFIFHSTILLIMYYIL